MAIGLLLLRLSLGLTLASHGAQKLLGWFGGYGPDGTGKAFETLGFKPGRRFAIAAGGAELLAATSLVFGLATPLGATIAIAVMIVGAVSVHARNGFFVSDGGYEYNLIFGVSAWLLAFTGPGRYSLDGLFGWERAGVAWGAGAIVVAALGASLQLAQRDPLPVE